MSQIELLFLLFFCRQSLAGEIDCFINELFRKLIVMFDWLKMRLIVYWHLRMARALVNLRNIAPVFMDMTMGSWLVPLIHSSTLMAGVGATVSGYRSSWYCSLLPTIAISEYHCRNSETIYHCPLKKIVNVNSIVRR